MRELGVRQGGILMAHVRISALGWVVGGTQTVVEAVLEAIGADGTLMVYAGWEDDTWHIAAWPPEWQEAYRREMPPFDQHLSGADHDMGRFAERVRTWPGAVPSSAHVMRMIAVGPDAEWLTADHPWDHGNGPGSPLAKLVEAEGQVLMLGAPLEKLTLLHHAEALVDSPEKRLVTYPIPVREGDAVVWREVQDHDTSGRAAFPYDRFVPKDVDEFEFIARAALKARCGVAGKVGESTSHLFEAKPLLEFAVRWLEDRFGSGARLRPGDGGRMLEP